MNKINDKQFATMLCDVLKNEDPDVVYNLLHKAGIDVEEDESVMDIVKEIRKIK